MRAQNGSSAMNVRRARQLTTNILFAFSTLCIVGLFPLTTLCQSSDGIQRHRSSRTEQARPECALNITCLDESVRLGNRSGACIHADCAGVVAVLHQRSDDASFRRRFVSYRHFAFEGRLVLKDQGTLESGAVRSRELFLVLPGDVIEFKTAGDDCLAKIDIWNLGYVKKGSLSELQCWLAEKTFMEIPHPDQTPAQGGAASQCGTQSTSQVRDAVCTYEGTRILQGVLETFKRFSLHP